MDPDFYSLMLWMQITKMLPALDSIFNTIKFLVKIKIENWEKSQLLISVPAIMWPKIIQSTAYHTSISNNTNVKRMELLINFKKVCVSSQEIHSSIDSVIFC